MLMECWRNKKRKTAAGFSLVELLLAGALFALFAGGVVTVLFSGLAADRLGEETTIATEYAREGIEAVRAIRDARYDDLVTTDSSGLARDNGTWTLVGTSDQFGKYTRVVRIGDGRRDADGQIAENGAPDAGTRRVTVSVSWNVTPTRADSVVLDTYFTQWR